MRFESLTLEKYGRSDSRTLNFAATPGLVLIYGPNEAGKSTSLEAISDFLYGIPDQTTRGHVFGYASIRLSATLVLADGTRLSTTRRKGRTRTLTDEVGQAVDEAVFTRFLGSTGRERFASLFGLNHETLRTGGQHLLAADGNIGRLILEAGGGLRSLVEMVDELKDKASSLFDTRRKADRLFYIGLDTFAAADAAFKKGVMTREEYVKARQTLNAAEDAVTEHRTRLSGLTQETLRYGRLARVVPTIREFDRVKEELSVFADLPVLRGDFPISCKTALEALKRGENDLREAEARCNILQAKIAALALPMTLLDAETAIRDVGEKAIHVGKARDDRSNREVELAKLSDELKTVRHTVGLASDAELEAAAPAPEAIETAQRLAAQALEHRGKIASLIAECARETKTLEAIAERQNARRAAGEHEPFGVSAADFANLAALTALAESKERQAAQLKAEIDARLARNGFSAIDELMAWRCPDADVIQSQIRRQEVIEVEKAAVLDKIATATEKRDKAASDIQRLLAGRDVPSTAMIEAAREERDRIWNEIKARYLSSGGAAVAARSEQGRLSDVGLQEERGKLADALADRKSDEADRIAALDLAQREHTSAVSTLAALAQQGLALDGQLAAASAAWSAAWPEAVKRAENLGRLKLLSDECVAALARYADWRAQVEGVEAQKADIAPRLEALSQAEAKLKLPATSPLSARTAAASKSIKAHDDAYADFRQDENALRGVQLKLSAIEDSQVALQKVEAKWRAIWDPAVRALGLNPPLPPERVNEVATQWAAAAGLLSAVRIVRHRLRRMDDDEAALLAAVRGIAPSLEFPLPLDAVAAAKMLVERLDAARKIEIARGSLMPQLNELIAERGEKKRLAESIRAEVDALCREASCEPRMLAQFAERCEQRNAMANRLKTLAEAIVTGGDDLSIEALRAEWGGRDLDEIKAAALRLESESAELAKEFEAALVAQQDRKRELDALSAYEGLNALAAERERAIAEIHGVLERYVEIALAEDLLRAAMDRLRERRKDPLILRAGALFAASTAGAFAGVETDIDGKGLPVVVGRRTDGEQVPVAMMSDGVRDQLYLSFRIASIEQYCQAAEPLPFIADDLLVHFDDDRGLAALGLLAELGRTTQVLVFTHHRHVIDAATPLVAAQRAAIIDLSAG
ncbi:MAG: AAA family ATPase [Methylocella sp.]